jgi:hypothetical protein
MALVLYEGDEPGGECYAVRTAGKTAGSETGVQSCIPSVDGEICAVAVVQIETGTELGSSDPAVKCNNSAGEPLSSSPTLEQHLSSEIKIAELARSPVGSCLT